MISSKVTGRVLREEFITPRLNNTVHLSSQTTSLETDDLQESIDDSRIAAVSTEVLDQQLQALASRRGSQLLESD